jgi:preprotein translocase subunit SecG
MTLLLILQVLLAVSLIALILLQRGRGADTGAAFGSGASTTVFGARGSASFLSRTTAVLAICFFSNCFVLSYLSSRVQAPKSVMEQLGGASPALEEALKKAVEKAAAAVPPPAKSETPSVPDKAASSEVPTVKPDSASVPAPAPTGSPAPTAPAN